MLSMGGGGGSSRRRGVQWGEGEGGGDISSTCHTLHYHMVLRPEGISHNNEHELHVHRDEHSGRVSFARPNKNTKQ